MLNNLKNQESLGGKVWDCSENLSRAKYHSLPFEDHHKQFIDLATEEGLCKCHHDERYSVIKFYEPPEEYLLKEWELILYRTYIEIIGQSIVYNDESEPDEFLSATQINASQS